MNNCSYVILTQQSQEGVYECEAEEKSDTNYHNGGFDAGIGVYAAVRLAQIFCLFGAVRSCRV